MTDEFAFVELLSGHGVSCLPGRVVELPGCFRISLTANENMIKGSPPGFAAVLRRALSGTG